MLRGPVAIPFLIFVLITVGCSFVYTVEISNLSGSTVVIRLTQYHAEDFSGTRPAQFTDSLLSAGGSRNISVRAGETIEVEFSDAAGGFWVKWRQTEPVADNPASGILDLLRDDLTITIEDTPASR